MKSGRFMALLCLASCILLAFGILTPSVAAQTFYGTVMGNVTDISGAVIPGAKVTLINTGTAERRTAMTDGNGNYRFVNLIPGVYRVEIEQSGFKRLARDGVQVQVEAALRVNGVLEVGNITQEIEVSAQTPLLQTESSALSQVVEGRTVQEMPLNGRNVMNLIALVPGVVPGGGSSGSPMANTNMGQKLNPNGWGNYQIGGGMGNQSASYFDGSPLNVSYVNSTVLVPTQDTVQEFRVASNSVSPEFGRFAGGVVNIASKSGTNQFHGSAYEYFRNKVLNANYFFNNMNHMPNPPFNQNQYGVSAGGPLIKNKTFFMFSWEGFKMRLGIPTTKTVPTAAQRAGDFSAPGIPKIYDPATTCGLTNFITGLPNPACTDINGDGKIEYDVRQQFPNNIIPSNRLDPWSINKINLTGLPNLPGIVNNFMTNGPGGGDFYQFNVRGDQVISNKQRLFVRYSRWVGTEIPPDIYGNQTERYGKYFTNNVVIGDTYSFTPRMVLDVRASYVRFDFTVTPQIQNPDLSKYFGPAWDPLQKQMSYKTVVGGPSFNVNNNIVLTENLTYIVGRHTLKFGAESRRIDYAHAEPQNVSGGFSFNQVMTAQIYTDSKTGYATASQILGYATSGSIATFLIPTQLMWYHGAFFSDIFQVTPKLTLNLGVRWEYPGSFKEKYDAASVILPDAADPLGQTVGPVNGQPLKGPVALTNSSLYPSRLIHPAAWNLFTPRIGFAYRLNDRTVIRSGYGLSYLPSDLMLNNAPWISPALMATTPMVATTDGGKTPYNTFSNPWPNGIIQPPGHSDVFASTLIGTSIQSPVPDQPTPYVQQWNLTIQRQFAGDMALEAGYAGSKGTHLPLTNSFQIDQLPDQYLSMGSALMTKVANPFYGKVPITAGILAQPTVIQGQLLRPFPQYTGASDTSDMAGDSTYHSLQMKLEKRFKQGGSLLTSYTWAKLISNADTVTMWLEATKGVTSANIQNFNNLGAERSVVSQDVPYRLVISYVLDLPFGKGKKLMSGVSGITDKLISGWGVNGTAAFQSGTPLVFAAQGNVLSQNFGAGQIRPNILPNCNIEIVGPAQDRLNQWFNTACFTQPGAYEFGNAPRAYPHARVHGVNNWDLSISKNTTIHEEMTLRFQAEFFNLFNRAQFQAPATTLGDRGSVFGQVTAQRNYPRMVQFALRLTF